MVKPYKRFQSQSHEKEKRPTIITSLMLIACLVVEIIQHWIVVFADPLWPYIKVIETSVSRYALHKSTIMPSLDAMV